MITTELISALSNIIKFFMGTLNNYTHLLPLLINVTSASGFKIWNEMLNINRKFCRRNPSKKKQESFLNILDWRFLFQAWWDNVLYKFKHCKIETNCTCSWNNIFIVHLDILKDFLSFTMNVFHFPFSFLVYLLMFF